MGRSSAAKRLRANASSFKTACRATTKLILCRSSAQVPPRPEAVSTKASGPTVSPPPNWVVPESEAEGLRRLEAAWRAQLESTPDTRLTPAEIEQWQQKAVGKRLIVDGQPATLRNAHDQVLFWTKFVEGRIPLRELTPEVALDNLRHWKKVEDQEKQRSGPNDNDFHLNELPCPAVYTNPTRILRELPLERR